MTSSKVTIRYYSPDDYTEVCQLFSAGIYENWLPAYRRILTGSAPRPALVQLVLICLLYIISSSFLWFLLAEVLVQAVTVLLVFHIYWNYVREHMATDMADKELSFWTGRGAETAGFFVATVGKEVVGTISYIKQSKDHIEIFRVSTAAKFRKAGIGSQLVARIEGVGAELKCSEMTCETSAAQEAAVVFYKKNGWIEQSRTSFSSSIIHGLEIVKFTKSLQHES